MEKLIKAFKERDLVGLLSIVKEELELAEKREEAYRLLQNQIEESIYEPIGKQYREGNEHGKLTK